MTNPYLTPRQLFESSLLHGLEDQPLRICDGMAVSYLPEEDCIYPALSCMVIDVSTLQPIEWDDLPQEMLRSEDQLPLHE